MNNAVDNILIPSFRGRLNIQSSGEAYDYLFTWI